METTQYIDMFLDESREHLQAVNDHILQLEKQPGDLTLVDEIFRSAHTLKGMAATMEFEDIASLTHHMENVLDKIRNSQLAVSTELIDIIFLALDSLEEMVNAISEGSDGKKDVSGLVSRLEQLETGTSKENQPEDEKGEEKKEVELDEFQATVVAQAEEQGFHTYQITVTLAEDCMLKSVRAYMVFEAIDSHGELIKTIPEMEVLEEGEFEQDFSLFFLSKTSSEEMKELIYNVSEVKDVQVSTVSPIKESKMVEQATEETSATSTEEKPAQGKNTSSKTIRVNLDRIDELMNLFEEIVIDRSRLEDLAEHIENPELTETVEHVTRVSEDMQGLILGMRMVPVDQVFNRFPRMVRGLAKDLDKKINLEIIGAETELDRTVIDEIGDPLVHLIRNSIDHGIESTSERIQAGKSESGELTLRAFHSGNHVFIEIEDDGAGINRKKVEAKAIEQGLLTIEKSKEKTDNDIFQLLLASGFSTADEVSDISGRGVGLDVVKNKIESLGGQIDIESKHGMGSKFSIQLPLTLSILSTLLVKVQHETYAVPLSSIIETVLLEEEQMMYAHGQKVMDFRGKVIPLVSLAEVFNVPKAEDTTEKHHAIVVIKKGEKVTGIIVDSFIGQKEVVLKSLGNYMQDVYAISGATILGDGQVALIIDPNALIK
ncbi:two-component system chemotaxis sensor kinase CheA [Virgibacillus natechei]|uniref:Chemotaxis protein CheA n=1 Tax=Virgibacillus natechei TaxID=1216297 RepID=A0ABS4ILP5_9BACI|nr:chemotaxis protein CheA [Virgibacillus natechei]MBP1971211.1 two-component system chemotaxis sensor kinase CheA [Virgibacillus natechei]UZD11959.1 chemotaxis protein CheA [Virgibacillus natechei]